MLAVERPETPKYKLCKGREEGGAINRVGAFITVKPLYMERGPVELHSVKKEVYVRNVKFCWKS